MSFHKTDAAIQASTSLTRAQKDVLAYLTSCAILRGYAWPSYDAIMKDCAIKSRATVRKATVALEAQGYIKIKHGERKGKRNLSNRYRIIQQAKPPKPKKETDVKYKEFHDNEVVKHQSRLKIKSLKTCRAMLEKSGAMNLAIGTAMAEQLKVLTTNLATL